MEAVILTGLPMEVIQYISCYLSVKDVLSCSLTCHYMRTALNDNYVWRKYLPQDMSSLETQDQQVYPALNLRAGLTPLCERRQDFIRKTHIMNNLRTGQYVQYRSSSDYWLSSALFNQPKGVGNMVYKDKYLFIGRFINDCESNGVEIWDISKDPKLYSFLKIDNVNYDGFYIVGQYLIIAECLRVHVHQITLPEKDFPLCYTFIITENNVSYKEVIHHDAHNFECVSWSHSFVGNYLLSNKIGESTLHIWDLDRSSKVGSFKPPIYAFYIILHSFTGSNWMFKLMAQSCSIPNYLVTFDIDKKLFSKNKLSFDSIVTDIISHNNHIILIRRAEDYNSDGLHDIICNLYDFNTSLELKQRRFINASKGLSYLQSNLSSPSIVNGTFVITCHDRFLVLNALTLETVDNFKHNNLNSIERYINMYQSIVVVATKGNSRIELWDISRKDTLLKNIIEMCTSHIYYDDLFTKLVYINSRDITVIHLW